MKKILFLVIILALIILSGCSPSTTLPKGHADYIYIDYGSGQTVKDVDFEYVTETTVKITDSEGIIYVPINNIKKIVILNQK